MSLSITQVRAFGLKSVIHVDWLVYGNGAKPYTTSPLDTCCKTESSIVDTNDQVWHEGLWHWTAIQLEKSDGKLAYPARCLMEMWYQLGVDKKEVYPWLEENFPHQTLSIPERRAYCQPMHRLASGIWLHMEWRAVNAKHFSFPRERRHLVFPQFRTKEATKVNLVTPGHT